MKTKALLCLASLLSLCSVGAIIPDLLGFTIDFPVIGPYEENANDITLTGRAMSRNTINNVRERLSVGVVGEDYSYFLTNSAHSYVARTYYSLTFNLPLKTYLNKQGLNARIQLLDSSSEVLKEFTFTLKPINPKTINVHDYLKTYYHSDSIMVDPDMSLFSHDERYIFDGFLDYFNIDYYYRLDLNSLYMTYDCELDFPETSGVLSFIDYDHLFPYLTTSGTLVPSFELPVTVYEKDGKIRFKLTDLMFVHPETLEMSLKIRPGFMMTSYFYLPINKCNKMIDQVFTLKVDDFGYNRNNFSWNIRYINNRYLIGDCEDSDYCVVGEVI